MIFLKSVAVDFFNCCGVPLRIVDKNMNLISEVGYSSFYDYIFKDLNLNSKFSRDYKKNHFNDTMLITFENKISFYSMLNYSSIDSNLIFVIGPFYIKEDLNLNDKDFEIYDLKVKNKNCLKYYNELLKIILDDKLKDTKLTSYSPYVSRAIDFLKENYPKNISIDEICSDFKINKTYFCNLFKTETGSTFINFVNNYRVEKSKDLLKNLDLSLLEIAIKVGFANQSYYCTVFKKFTNQTPLKYRESLFKN